MHREKQLEGGASEPMNPQGGFIKVLTRVYPSLLAKASHTFCVASGLVGYRFPSSVPAPPTCKSSVVFTVPLVLVFDPELPAAGVF